MKNLLALLLLSFITLADDKGHESLMATLYVQESAEYKAHIRTTFKTAEATIPFLLKQKEISASINQMNGEKNFFDKPPAIILDVDETVFNNSAYQARLIVNNTNYPDGWIEWVKEEKSTFLPGALSYMKTAKELGVEIFFVTNRLHELEPATRNNLVKEGFDLSDDIDQILTRYEKPSWDRNKTSRIALIAEDYRIIQIIGDNLGDFIDGQQNKKSSNFRKSIVEQTDSFWGFVWFMIANPTYGDWEGSVINFDYEQSENDQIKKKLNALDLKNE